LIYYIVSSEQLVVS